MNRILLITGASSEVGVALIKSVATEYDYIWAHYNSNLRSIEQLQSQFNKKIIPIKADFAIEDEVNDMVNRIISSGRIPTHVVHFSSPKVFHEKFQKRKWAEYQNGIDTSVRSIVMILEALVPRMVKSKNGKIIFMLTSYLTGTAPKYQSPYITVKYALYGLMRTLASELAEKRIMVNAVSPDMMETKFLSEVPDIAVRMNADANPLKRNIRIEDVIPTIQYLLSDAADTITGQNIAVTAGAELV